MITILFPSINVSGAVLLIVTSLAIIGRQESSPEGITYHTEPLQTIESPILIVCASVGTTFASIIERSVQGSVPDDELSI